MQGLFCLEGCHDSAGCCIGRQEHLGRQAGLPVEAQCGDVVGLCSAALGAEGAHIDLSALQLQYTCRQASAKTPYEQDTVHKCRRMDFVCMAFRLAHVNVTVHCPQSLREVQSFCAANLSNIH